MKDITFYSTLWYMRYVTVFFPLQTLIILTTVVAGLGFVFLFVETAG